MVASVRLCYGHTSRAPVLIFTPKGWDNIAQGAALGSQDQQPPSLKGWDKRCRSPSGCKTKNHDRGPGALPRAKDSHPFGVKAGPYGDHRTTGCSVNAT